MRGAILSGMMGGLSLLPILTDRQVGPSRFPGGWQQVANRSPLASRSVERLASEPPADYVRFTPKSGHQNSVAKCPLCTNSGLMHYSNRGTIHDKYCRFLPVIDVRLKGFGL